MSREDTAKPIKNNGSTVNMTLRVRSNNKHDHFVNDINKLNDQHESRVESMASQREMFNNEYCVGINTTDISEIARNYESHRNARTLGAANTPPPFLHYENVCFNSHQIDKKLLLQKYFRSALVGPRDNVYENLCRGCNYGVFTARGPLCTFCECIVNGVSSVSNSPTDSSANIYENICELCGKIYSGFEEYCNCRKDPSLNIDGSGQGNLPILQKVASEEFLQNYNETKVKLKKTKSFNKTLFTNFWGTLKSKARTVETKQNLEIIHNYDDVYHTQDTFDLQRICELKRDVNSQRDQHIYGRLKPKELEPKTAYILPQLLTHSSDSINTELISSANKHSLSKTKFLRSRRYQIDKYCDPNSYTRQENTQKLNLPGNVCQWLASLRFEINSYVTNTQSVDDDTFTVCYPKSIPAKYLLNFTRSATSLQVMQTESVPFLQDYCNLIINFDTQITADSAETVTLRRHSNYVTASDNATESLEFQHSLDNFYQQMVQDFKLNLITKQMYKQDNKAVSNNSPSAASSTGVSLNIPLRHQTNNNNNKSTCRIKRQGIYLRTIPNQNNVYDYCRVSAGENDCNYNESECVHLKFSNSGTDERAVVTTYTVLQSFSDLSLPANYSVSHGKRCGIHERSISFDTNHLQKHEGSNDELSPQESRKKTDAIKINANLNTPLRISEALQPFVKSEGISNITFRKHIFHTVVRLIKNHWLSTSLNTTVISYDKCLVVFLRGISESHNKYKQIQDHKLQLQHLNDRLVRKYKQLYKYCLKLQTEKQRQIKTQTETLERILIAQPLLEGTRKVICSLSLNLELDLCKTNLRKCENKINLIKFKNNKDDSDQNSFRVNVDVDNSDSPFECEIPKKTLKKRYSLNENSKGLQLKSCLENTQFQIYDHELKAEFEKVESTKILKVPPQVPRRDPKTKLSPTKEIIDLPSQVDRRINMTIPSNDMENNLKEESIYQPIWNFKTVGEAADGDYYYTKQLNNETTRTTPSQKDSDESCEIPCILISHEGDFEDQNEWETDEEFIFATQLTDEGLPENTSQVISTYPDHKSSNSSLGSKSLSGSTITGFASSTATLASISSSLMHHIYRNVGIFYSLTEPKIRAIKYDYDRVHASSYYSKPYPTTKKLHNAVVNDSGLAKSPGSSISNDSTEQSSVLLPHISNEAKLQDSKQSSNRSLNSESEHHEKKYIPPLIPKCVQVWKFQLLDVNYMEDEEDMIVSETEILRKEEIKGDGEHKPQPEYIYPQPKFTQLYKSCSTDNILGLIEDDKRTLAERIADKWNFGILKINTRSPKNEKRKNRPNKTASLYLEDGLKSKFPIFAVPLERLELNQTNYPNVPRFVVDAVEYIEHKDRIIQDGLYRACGNKFNIDELKQKLSESYIYDPKLIIADDIHTITSLLKQFFRELGSPLVPQDTYERFGRNLSDKKGIASIRLAIETMKEPNKSTLQFIIKHLTNVAAHSDSNRMHASNLAIVWGPCLLTANQIEFDIGRMNTFAKILIENYETIFVTTNERLVN